MNLYVYVRDNPEKLVDPNGHMALSIDSTDDTNPSVPSTSALFSSFNLQASIKASQLPVLIDMRRVSYTPSPITATMGTGTKSVDVTLTTSGVNQYANKPTIGQGDLSVGGQVVNCFEHQCGAIAVTGASLDISIGLSLLTAASATGNVVDPVGPAFIPVTLGLGSLTAASWDATIEMGTYDYQYGSKATPQGALEHGGQGILQLIDWLTQHVP